MFATAARENWPVQWRLAAGVMALNTAGIFLFADLDLTLASLTAFGAVCFVLTWRAAKLGEPAALAFTGMISMGVLLAFFRPDQFVDNAAYVLGSAALATYAWRTTSKQDPADDPCGAVDIGHTSIVSITAEGNYARILKSDGQNSLVRKPISSFMIETPLMRVHRSHIVNLALASRLVSKPGSRYELVLDDGRRLPVSRKLAARVRDEIAQRRTRTGEL
jgi:hypothetical protein